MNTLSKADIGLVNDYAQDVLDKIAAHFDYRSKRLEAFEELAQRVQEAVEALEEEMEES